MAEQNSFSWKIVELPSIKNDFSRLINLMRRYKNYPWPFYLISNASKEVIKMKFELSKVDFNYDFNCLFGNLKGGGSVWFTNTYILDYAPIYFGEHVTIGPDVKLITSTHDLSNFNIVNAKSIFLEDNVWLTMNVIVLPGVRIGANSVVAAGSVVTTDIPANSLAAGNPAKVIKQINRSYPYWNELNTEVKVKYKKTFFQKLWRKLLSIPNKIIIKIIKIFL